MLFQTIYSTDFESVKALYMDGYKQHAGGGIICGSIFFGIRKLLGVPGACIVMFIAAVCMFILITEISIIDGIKSLTENARARRYDEDDDEEDTDDYDDEEDINAVRDDVYDEYEGREPVRQRGRSSAGNRRPAPADERRNRSPMSNLDVYGSKNEKTEEPRKKEEPKDFFAREEVHEFHAPDSVRREPERTKGRATDRVERIFMADEEAAASAKAEPDVAAEPAKSAVKSAVNAAVEPAPLEDKEGLDDVLAGAINGNMHPESVSDYDPAEDSAFAEPERKAEPARKTANTAGTEKTYQEGRRYKLPTPDLLGKPAKANMQGRDAYVRETAIKLKNTLETFGVNVTITNYSCGPAVTRFEMQPEQGVKVSKILGLADDIKLNLAAADIRIEAPIPGKAAIGIEVPNKEQSMVAFRELIESDNFRNLKTKLAFAVGKDISGQVIATDIAKMPHLLIAGATGSGKSVCINTLIMSILYKATPEEVKLIMIDPKMVELACYNGIPHLLIPVVTDPKKAAGALNWAVVEMTRRYQLFAECSVRNIQGYNDKVENAVDAGADGEKLKKLPQIVVIVDELADLMMVAHGEVEDAIVRLSQLARAAGIHLVIATQRPSVDVITGLIKANVPSRIAFSVSSGVDSRTILDMVGAEKLLGKGDMLFYPTGYPKPVRVQGAFVSDDEVTAVVDFLKKNNGIGTYDDDIEKTISGADSGAAGSAGGSGGNDKDDYFVEAGRFIIEKEKASIGMLQRTFKIGFNRAARIMDQLTAAGVVGPEMGTKARSILMTQEEFDDYIDNNM